MHVKLQDHVHLVTLNFAILCHLNYIKLTIFSVCVCVYTFCKSLLSFILDSYADRRILLNVVAALLIFSVYCPADLEFSFEHLESIR